MGVGRLGLMTIKERLHKLVEKEPEDPLLRAIANAPEVNSDLGGTARLVSSSDLGYRS
jgi:hypothetical protein